MIEIETQSSRSLKRMVRLFRDGIGIRCWHRYGKPHGTAIRWMRCKPGLIGVMVKDSGLHVGIWWQIRFEMLAVHVAQFEPNE